MQEDKMKTKSDFPSRVIHRRGLFILLRRARYLAAVLLILVAVLLTGYSTIANTGRSGRQVPTSTAGIYPAEDDQDPKYREKRDEFLRGFFGTEPGGVSPSAYTSALAAAHALPPSPLLQGRRFVSPETLEVVAPWSSPIAPPIRNSYGGNASARIHTLAIDPINANVVYTGSFGGLAKTTDGGVTWRYLSDAWASQSISSIAVSPNASNIVYVGTGRSDYAPYGVGLYRSSDGGTTWHRLGTHFAGTYIRTIAVDPNTRESLATVYVANGCTDTCGLSRSTNSGRTWTQLYQVHNGIYDVAIDASTHPSTLYVTEDDGTFKSTDSGQSWTPIHSVLAGSRNQVSVVNSTLYLLGPRDPDHNLYKSIDRGARWTQIPTKCFDEADSCANDDGGIGFSVFAVDPFNPNVILGGNQALYRTDNGGLTWTEVGHWWGDPDPAQAIHTDQRVIAFSRTAPGVAYDGNDGGVVRSTDAGQQWTNLNQNLPGALLYSVALSADGSMIAGTQDNGAVFSSVGAPWNMILGGDSYHNLIDPNGSTWAYSVLYSRRSFRRFNRETHEKINISPAELNNDAACSFFPAFSMNPSSPTHLIAACQHVVRTLDGPTVTSDGWTTIGGSLPDPVSAAYEAPSNSNVIYAVADRRRVWVTTNADSGPAAVWSDITKNLSGGVWAITVHPIDPQTAYLACNAGVYKTSDMGTTWTQQGVPNLFYRDVAIDPANPQHVFAASFAGVFASTDGGITWGNMSDGIPAGMMVSGLSFNAMSRQLGASTYGRGVYVLNLGTPSVVSISSSADLATTSGL
jgi:photosystem II stability/assembly factor-like uncharacterized protein